MRDLGITCRCIKINAHRVEATGNKIQANDLYSEDSDSCPNV